MANKIRNYLRFEERDDTHFHHYDLEEWIRSLDLIDADDPTQPWWSTARKDERPFGGRIDFTTASRSLDRCRDIPDPKVVEGLLKMSADAPTMMFELVQLDIGAIADGVERKYQTFILDGRHVAVNSPPLQPMWWGVANHPDRPKAAA
jgi:hypothetical protein